MHSPFSLGVCPLVGVASGEGPKSAISSLSMGGSEGRDSSSSLSAVNTFSTLLDPATFMSSSFSSSEKLDLKDSRSISEDVESCCFSALDVFGASSLSLPSSIVGFAITSAGFVGSIGIGMATGKMLANR